MKRLRLGAALIAVALAAACSWLALDVRAWQHDLRRDDLRFQTHPADETLWRGPGGPAGRAAEWLLGLRDDVAFRRAEAMFGRGGVQSSSFGQERTRLAVRGNAQEALAHLETSDPLPARRAQAGNLLGLLLLQNSQSSPAAGADLTEQGVRAFQAAARAEPSADDAKFNLELLLNLLQPRKDRRRDAPQQTGFGGFGAGLARPGRGY